MKTGWLGAMLAASVTQAAPCPSRAVWPGEEWPSRAAETAAARASAIGALESYAFTLQGTDAERQGIRTDGVVIIQGGAVVYERYARGYEANKRHLAWSVSKSFLNATVGAAVAQGYLSIDDSICKHLALTGEEHCRVTVKHLLEFSSGLDWREVYENQSNQVSSVLAMLYGEGQQDMVGFIARHPSRTAPGESFAYSSGDSTLLAGVLDAAVRNALGEEYPWKLLFDVLGIKSAVWERDGKGVPVGSSYVYATPRDLARLGFLALNDGCWASGRVLPEGWMAESVSVSEAFKKQPLGTDGDDVQGRQWWLNRPVPEQNVSTPWPDVPDDAFAARGHWGQSITVIPSLDLVVVRVADDRQRAFNFNEFLKLAIAVGRP